MLIISNITHNITFTMPVEPSKQLIVIMKVTQMFEACKQQRDVNSQYMHTLIKVVECDGIERLEIVHTYYQ